MSTLALNTTHAPGYYRVTYHGRTVFFGWAYSDASAIEYAVKEKPAFLLFKGELTPERLVCGPIVNRTAD